MGFLDPPEMGAAAADPPASVTKQYATNGCPIARFSVIDTIEHRLFAAIHHA